MSSLTEMIDHMVSTEMIDHVVLLNIRDDNSLKVDARIKSINGLASLPGVIFLSVVPIALCHGFLDGLHFTHLLHARYTPPSPTSTPTTPTPPTSAFSQSSCPCPPPPSSSSSTGPVEPLLPGQALRLTAFKLKDGAVGDKKREILEGLSNDKGNFEMTYGEEVSVETAKGFTVVAMAVFADLNGLEACGEYEDTMRSLGDKFKDAIDGVIFVDYYWRYIRIDLFYNIFDIIVLR